MILDLASAGDRGHWLWLAWWCAWTRLTQTWKDRRSQRRLRLATARPGPPSDSSGNVSGSNGRKRHPRGNGRLSTCAKRWTQRRLRNGLAAVTLGRYNPRRARQLQRMGKLEGLEHHIRKVPAHRRGFAPWTLRSSPRSSVFSATLGMAEEGVLSPKSTSCWLCCANLRVAREVDTGPQEGLDAWRHLVVNQEPSSWTRSAVMLQALPRT